MNATTKELQEKVLKLFDEEKITKFIGYEQGSLPYKTKPCIITKKEDIKRLIFNMFSVNNLSIYLRGSFDKVGIIANVCTIRSIVMLIQQKQINPANIHIIAAHCPGMIDEDKVKGLSLMKIKSLEDRDDKFVIITEDGEKEFKKTDVLYDKCKTCNHELPKIYQDLIGEEIPVSCKPGDEYAFLNELEKLSADKRWELWDKEFAKCIRCYACRNVCPVCFCKECMVSKTTPQWVSKLNQSSINEFYSLMRIIHVMGRCTDCGECERVCPSKIPFRKILKKMEKEIKEKYGYIPGTDPEGLPPLATFKEDDPEEGIK